MRTPILTTLVFAATCGDAAPPGFSTGPAITSVSASTSGSSSTGDMSFTGPRRRLGGQLRELEPGIVRDVGTAMDFGPVREKLRFGLRCARRRSAKASQVDHQGCEPLREVVVEVAGDPSPLLLLGDQYRIEHAFGHLEAARTLSVPEVFADMLRADLDLTALHGDPRWSRLHGD